MKWQRKIAMLGLSLALIFSVALSASAAEQNMQSTSKTTPANSNITLGKVKINNNSYIELKNVNILPTNERKAVRFTVTFHNGDSKELSFLDYWVRVKTKSGSEFSPTLVEADKGKNKVAAQSSQDFTFYALISSSLDYKDLRFVFIKWDFSMANYEKVLGSIDLPSSFNPVAPINGKQNISIGKTNVEVSVDKMFLNKNDKYYMPKIYFNIVNNGAWKVDWPKYNYYVRTNSGLMYGLETKDAEGFSLSPKIEKSIQLSASIPVDAEKDNWTLVITEIEPTSKIELPIAQFQLPNEKDSVVSPDTFYRYTNDDGTYGFKVNSTQRLPWEDQDILAVEFAIKNLDSVSLPIPDLDAAFKLDDVQLDPTLTKYIKLDNLLGLQPNQEAHIIAYTKIPYTYNYSSVDVTLNEKLKQGDSTTNLPITDYALSSFKFNLPISANDSKYAVTNIGNRATVTVRDVKIYDSPTTRIAYIEVGMENNEKRLADMQKLTAYLKTDQNVYFPLTITKVEQKISPGGRALIGLWTKIPQQFTLGQPDIVIGQQVGTENDLAYIKGKELVLPPEKESENNELKDVEIYPYTISMNNIRADLNGSSGKISFNYSLKKDFLYEVVPDGHKLLMEVSDSSHKFSQEFELEKDLNIGDYSSSMSFTYDDTTDAIKSFDGFRISIYDSFEGHKRLLASRMIYKAYGGN